MRTAETEVECLAQVLAVEDDESLLTEPGTSPLINPDRWVSILPIF